MVRIKEVASGVQQGMQFGQWEVLGQPFRPEGVCVVVCRCQCGTVAVVKCHTLSSGSSSKCRSCASKPISLTHGLTKGGRIPRIYRIWQQMKSRCLNPRHKRYADYGGRGITLCEEWKTFSLFKIWADDNGYAERLTIERKDNDAGYSPENCKWIPKSKQAENTRRTVRLTAFGETKTAIEWARDSRCKVSNNILGARKKLGWDDLSALTLPLYARRPR